MIHVAYWVFVFCVSSGLAVLCLVQVDPGSMLDKKDPRVVRAKQCAAATLGFMAGLSFGYICYWLLTVPKPHSY